MTLERPETTVLHFVRDAWNRQVAVYEDDGDGVYEPGTDDSLVSRYEFDGANRRIEKTFADATGVDYFYNQQWQVLEERSVDDQGATTAVNQYVWSPRYIDAPVVRFHDGNADGDLLDAGDNTRYYAGDANFNVTATIDGATGDVLNRYVYGAYGEATVYDDAWSNPAAVAEDGPLYCGYWFDAETGNFQVRAREYITCLSTFDATDPIQADINLYRYCGNNPSNGTDPSGLDWAATWEGIKAGADEFFVVAPANIGRGAFAAGREMTYFLRDAGASTVSTAAALPALIPFLGLRGYDVRFTPWSNAGKFAERLDNPNYWGEAWQNAGRAVLAGETLGISEIGFGTYDYVQTGDSKALQKHMGGVAAGNLAGAAGLKGGQVLRNLRAPSSGLSGGAQRAAQYGSKWQAASLEKAVARHAGENYTSWITKGGKQIFENPATGRDRKRGHH